MNYFCNQKKQHGFTVIEMIVVISIFSIFGGILMFNYKGFQKNQDFSIFAQEVGLLIKEQQQNAMAGLFPSIDPNTKIYPALEWKPSYGVYMKPGVGTEIIKFYDGIVPDHAYTQLSLGGCDLYDDECLSVLTVGNGRSIDSIKVGGVSVSSLSIVFTRPYPDARMYMNYSDFSALGSGDDPHADLVTDTVEIFFKDPGVDGYNIVSINPTGAISIRREQ